MEFPDGFAREEAFDRTRLFGYIGNSTALLADAGHNLSDVLGLLVAWGASVASKHAPSAS